MYVGERKIPNCVTMRHVSIYCLRRSRKQHHVDKISANIYICKTPAEEKKTQTFYINQLVYYFFFHDIRNSTLLSDKMGYFRKKFNTQNISCSMCFKCRQQMWFALAHRNICITDIQLRPHLNTLSKILALFVLMGILPFISVGLQLPSPVMKCVAREVSLRNTQTHTEKMKNATAGHRWCKFSGEQWPWRKRRGSTAERAFCRELGGDFMKGRGSVASIAGSMIERAKSEEEKTLLLSQAWRKEWRIKCCFQILEEYELGEKLCDGSSFTQMFLLGLVQKEGFV